MNIAQKAWLLRELFTGVIQQPNTTQRNDGILAVMGQISEYAHSPVFTATFVYYAQSFLAETSILYTISIIIPGEKKIGLCLQNLA